MKAPLHNTFALSLAFLLRPTYAGTYYIDRSSCNLGQTAFVRASMNGAFDMATKGLAGASAAPNTPQDQLTQWLFGQTGTLYHNGMYNGVLDINTEVDSMDALAGGPRIIIYCDETRFQRRQKDPLHIYDSSIQQAVSKAGSLWCSIVAAAYTATPPTNKKGISIPNLRQIQICPWFLNYALAQQIFATSLLGNSFWDKLKQKGLPKIAQGLYTPIDFVSMTDKVLLHELTHAIQNYNLATTDVGGLGGFLGYGWKNVLKLATKVTDPTTGVQGPERNADTWALYGSASLIISNGENVLQNGSLVAAPATSQDDIKLPKPKMGGLANTMAMANLTEMSNLTERAWRA